MVCDWSPEPPRDVEDRMSIPSQVVAVESDESEDETLGNAPPGYELLPQGPALGLSSDEEDQSDTEEGNAVAASSSFPSEGPSTSNALTRRASEVEEVARLYSLPALRPELTVDCEEVRAAMSGFSLPDSAYPSWATAVPESQWASTLAQQIQRLQARDATATATQRESC